MEKNKSMSRFYVIQELEKILNSRIISEECAKAVMQAISDVEKVGDIEQYITSTDNPFDIHNNNQAYRGFEYCINSIAELIKG